MKKIILLFIFIMLFTPDIFSWDSTAAKYYPMAIGNTWSVHTQTLSTMSCTLVTGESDYIIKITGDTIMPNGKKYFKFANGTYQRIDSIKMNVYKYSPPGECLLDSLFAKLNNCYDGCRYDNQNFNMCVFDTVSVLFAGQNRKVLKINSNPLLSETYTLMYGVGFYAHSYCEFGGIRETLNGCIINGVQYGTILGYEGPHPTYPLYSHLFQNYPNPFNPGTTIFYEFSKTGNVQIILYDLSGKEITKLVDQYKNPGRYKIEFSAENFASGLYFYRLIHDGIVLDTKKMLLIK